MNFKKAKDLKIEKYHEKRENKTKKRPKLVLLKFDSYNDIFLPYVKVIRIDLHALNWCLIIRGIMFQYIVISVSVFLLKKIPEIFAFLKFQTGFVEKILIQYPPGVKFSVYRNHTNRSSGIITFLFANLKPESD